MLGVTGKSIILLLSTGNRFHSVDNFFPREIGHFRDYFTCKIVLHINGILQSWLFFSLFTPISMSVKCNLILREFEVVNEEQWCFRVMERLLCIKRLNRAVWQSKKWHESKSLFEIEGKENQNPINTVCLRNFRENMSYKHQKTTKKLLKANDIPIIMHMEFNIIEFLFL